jgi:hypothetical protein
MVDQFYQLATDWVTGHIVPPAWAVDLLIISVVALWGHAWANETYGPHRRYRVAYVVLFFVIFLIPSLRWA